MSRQIDARFIKGLPDPRSAEATDWMRDTLAALQAADPRADVDLGGLEERLRDIEEIIDPLRRVDVIATARAVGAIVQRLDAIEARLDALEARETNVTVVEQRDPLDPLSWRTVDEARAALLILVQQEAARRVGHSVTLMERMNDLDLMERRGDLNDPRYHDERLELNQHQGWAGERMQVREAQLAHGMRIGRLDTLEAALTYPWRDNWPDLGRGGGDGV